MLITETKLDDSVSDTICEPPGFKIIRKDRSENFQSKYNMTGVGGGIAILHKKILKLKYLLKTRKKQKKSYGFMLRAKKVFY